MIERFELDTVNRHTITSNVTLCCAETGRVIAVFYNDYDAEALLAAAPRPEAVQPETTITPEMIVEAAQKEKASWTGDFKNAACHAIDGMVERITNNLLADEQQPAPRPVPTCERLPTVADGDPWSRLLAFSVLSNVWHIVRVHEVNSQEYSHWICYMRLPSPQRPTEPDGGAV